MLRYHISVDQFLLDTQPEKDTKRRQLDALLDDMSDTGIRIVTARRQVQTYYIIPYVIGLLHSIFAITCYKSALMDDLLGKSSAVLVPVLFSIAVFSAIYAIYYQLTKHSCYKIALN